MSEAPDNRTEIAEMFERNLDPLAEYAPIFESRDVDTFEPFLTDVLAARKPSANYRKDYERTINQWCEHMESVGRHPACPHEDHVMGFIEREIAKGNDGSTIKEKLRRLNQVFEYWQDDHAFPHSGEFNPIELAKSKATFEETEQKKPHNIPLEELREIVGDVTHVRDRLIIVLQLKLGLRATEVCNIKLSEIDIQHAELRDHYPELGTHPRLDGRENAILIPHDREGNKSQVPRALPIDDETRRALLRYLLIRPDNGEPWVILSKNNHDQLRKNDINKVWKEVFHPEYAKDDLHRAVTSHYGRHRFTTYWRIEQDLNRDLVKYMRGDTPGNASIDDRGAIDEYIHTYYEDIEPLYRERIYKLGV